MANYYYDCEFLEAKQDKRLLGIKYGQTKPTIDMISVGIVSEDDRSYYAISKEFNLKEAWNRWDGEYYERNIFEKTHGYPKIKKYWIRENVLKTIFNESVNRPDMDFTYRNMKTVLSIIGKTNKQIAEDIFQFCTQDTLTISKAKYYNVKYKNIELYGYYSAYDHVCLSWLFGKMINLPSVFPMYTKDLKQIFDEIVVKRENEWMGDSLNGFNMSNHLKTLPEYPKQENEHNALSDAKWNKKLHEFLKTL